MDNKMDNSDNSVENILVSCYRLWRENLILFVPFLCELVMIIILGIVLSLYLFFIFSASTEFSLLEILSKFFVILAIVIAYVLLKSFFTAGAIGMAKEVILKGNTNLQDMFLYGKKKFLTLFLFHFILLILAIPAIALLFLRSYSGIDIASLYIFAMSIILTPVPYAIVISNTSVLSGIEKGFKFIKENKLSFLLLWFFVEFITRALIALSLIFAFIVFIVISIFTFPSISSIEEITTNAKAIPSSLIISTVIALILFLILYSAISIFVIFPLINLWFSKLYTNRVENLK